MGLADIFGGSQKIDILTSGQRGLLNDLSGIVRDELGQPGEVYEGPVVPDRNSLMRGAYNQAALGGMQVDPSVMQALQPGLAGAQDTAGVRSQFDAALGPAQLEFNRALDQVGARYGDTWGNNGALPEMAGRATAEYGMGLNNLLANLTYNSQESARDRQLGAVSGALGAQSVQNQGLASQYDLGMADRGVTGQEYAADYSKWLSGQWENNPALGFINPVLGTSAYAIGETPGLIGGLTQAAGGVASLASAFKK